MKTIVIGTIGAALIATLAACSHQPDPVPQPQPQIVQVAPAQAAPAAPAAPIIVQAPPAAPAQSDGPGFWTGAVMGGLLGHALGSNSSGGGATYQPAPRTTVINRTTIVKNTTVVAAPQKPAPAPVPAFNPATAPKPTFRPAAPSFAQKPLVVAPSRISYSGSAYRSKR